MIEYTSSNTTNIGTITAGTNTATIMVCSNIDSTGYNTIWDFGRDTQSVLESLSDETDGRLQCRACYGHGYHFYDAINRSGEECVACGCTGVAFGRNRERILQHDTQGNLHLIPSVQEVRQLQDEEEKKQHLNQLRALRLLRQFLTDEQKKQLRQRGNFVAVLPNGHRYRFFPRSRSVEILGLYGTQWMAIYSLCLHPQDDPDWNAPDFPNADITLSQLLWLYKDEERLLKAANWTATPWFDYRCIMESIWQLPELKKKYYAAERYERWAIRAELREGIKKERINQVVGEGSLRGDVAA